MSYDTAIFFTATNSSDQPKGSGDIAVVLRQMTGLPFAPAKGAEAFLARGFGIEFWLHPRYEFVKEIEGHRVEDQGWQLEMRSSSASELIHPVSFWLAEQLSRVLPGTAVLTLSGIEILAAVFSGGQVTLDKMESAQRRVSVSGWHFL